MKRIALTATVGLVLVASTGCAQFGYNLRWKHKTAPDFELTALDDAKVKLSDQRGKPVLLTFWGYT